MVEFIHLAFTCMLDESYCWWLGSLLVCSCDVFQVLINSLACWFYTSALGLVLFPVEWDCDLLTQQLDGFWFVYLLRLIPWLCEVHQVRKWNFFFDVPYFSQTPSLMVLRNWVVCNGPPLQPSEPVWPYSGKALISLILLWLSSLFKKVVVTGHCLMTLPSQLMKH